MWFTSTVVDMSSDVDPPSDGPEVFLVLDAVDVDVVAAFWAAALHYRRVDRVDQYVVLVPMEGATGSVFLVQGVDEPKTVKNRMHLDLHVTDPEAEAERLVALGARRLGAGSLGEIAWICMSDPEGNEFDIGRR
jgi:predicted enzyme related to lactoylglutathione lyase